MVNILAIVKDEIYPTKLNEFVRDAAATNDAVLYVSLNKTYKSLQTQLSRLSVDLDKFYFIDTISSTLIPTKDTDRCVYVSTPTNVQGLYQGIIKLVKKKQY